MMTLLLLSSVIKIHYVIGVITPPSQFNTDCKYMTVVGENTDTWPIDSCYRTEMDWVGSRNSL
eukprot:UN10726